MALNNMSTPRQMGKNEVSSDELFGNIDDISESDLVNCKPESPSISSKPLQQDINDSVLRLDRIETKIGTNINYIKLPKLLSLETEQFNAETYEDPFGRNGEGRRQLQLKISNTIRWRQSLNDEGKLVTETNTRFVSWSDGSLTMHLGSEVFNVMKVPLREEFLHCFVQEGSVLQAVTVLRTRLAFCPASVDSYTHHQMKLAAFDRPQRAPAIKMLTELQINPEISRKKFLEEEREKERQARKLLRLQAKKKRTSKVHICDDDDESAITVTGIQKIQQKTVGMSPRPKEPRKTNLRVKRSARLFSSEDETDDREIYYRRRTMKIVSATDSE